MTTTLTHKEKPVPVTLHRLGRAAYTQQYRRHGYDQAVWYSKAFGIEARGFVSHLDGTDEEPVVYVREDAPLNVLAHELWHIWGGSHPADFLGCIRHAFRDGFTIGAFTSLLRWRDPDGFLPLARTLLDSTN